MMRGHIIMALLAFFAIFISAAAIPAIGQEGFLNIDCGLDAHSSGYTDPQTGLYFVSDEPYVDGGEVRLVSEEQQSIWPRYAQTLRTFPSGVRNCYMLPTVAGTKYLLRAEFIYGNYDGRSSSSVLFDLYLGVNPWGIVDRIGQQENEAVFMAWASWVPVCLERTSQSTPYVCYMQLIKLSSEMYPTVNATDQFMSRYIRNSAGPTTGITRYPYDIYDRIWWLSEPDPSLMWANLSTNSSIQQEPVFAVPVPILQTATTTAAANLTVTTWTDPSLREHMVFLHFADFQNRTTRQFDAYVNNNRLVPNEVQGSYSPPYLTAGCVFTSKWYFASDGKYVITLVPTAESVLPPMLNAFEIYTRIFHDNPMTFPQDLDAIMAIKLEYGIKKNWMGDPCFPAETAWKGIICSNSSGNTTRIISLDLSYSNLQGAISKNFTKLTALNYLNLSGNQLNGSIPESLCSSNEEPLIFRYKSDGDICNRTASLSPSRKRSTIIVVAPVLVTVILFVLAFFIWRAKRKPNISTHAAREPRENNDPRSRKYQENYLQPTETRKFTYKELEKITNRFQRFVGKGGFGPVYYGCLEDGTEVAVKIRSESASHGLEQFLAEVQSLTKVHHRNLVSLVGYCWEKDHLALVYEYMCRGNLHDLLRGRVTVNQNEGEDAAGETLNWATRVRIVLEAAQGLNYLHKGCNLPIIHRDMKTSNILLGRNLQAKIADLRLSKTFLTDTQSHMTVLAGGTIGYMDPQYYRTCRLTGSSDVYSFGVVLLEVATGASPILPEQDHIIQRVKQKMVDRDISSIADVRLGGSYDIASMWKVVDTAMLCTVDVATERPTMAYVVAELKDSLALEMAREDCSRLVAVSPTRDSVASVSTFDLSGR